MNHYNEYKEYEYTIRVKARKTDSLDTVKGDSLVRTPGYQLFDEDGRIFYLTEKDFLEKCVPVEAPELHSIQSVSSALRY